MQSVRITVAVAAVLARFLADPAAERYGYDLMKDTDYPSGKLYPILNRLENAGWLYGEFEVIDSTVEKRPPRRWYRLTDEGLAAAREALQQFRRETTTRRKGTK